MIRTLRRTWKRLLGSLSTERRESDLAEELESHIQLLTEDNLRRGVPPEEARRQTRLEFGGIESARRATVISAGSRSLTILGRTCVMRFAGFGEIAASRPWRFFHSQSASAPILLSSRSSIPCSSNRSLIRSRTVCSRLANLFRISSARIP